MKKLRLLTDQLVRNATYLGLSESTIQNMCKAAFESDPGVLIEVANMERLKEKKPQCKYYTEMPHHPLPNCTNYESQPSKFDIIGALFGKMIRMDKGRRHIRNGRNTRANRHVRNIMNQIGHYRDRGQNRYYWQHALRLMKSTAFQEMAFNYVCSGWYKNMSVTEANKILRQVTVLVREFKTEVNLRRVYIPKSINKVRPLGVPTKAWRVYLHMWNVLIVWFRMGTDPNQHAYFPGKGVHTAWLALLDRLDECNIYEFDLKSFFPSVNLKENSRLLSKLGVPEEIVLFIESLNRSITKLEARDELPEDKDRKVLLTSEGAPNPNLPEDIQESIINLWRGMTPEGREWLQSSNELKEILPEGWTVFKEVGVPQGASTSCGLATVNLHYLWKRLGNMLLMYADDGLVFPRTESDIAKIKDEARGVEMNPSKSGWVKENGVWKKPLKFLGLELIPPTPSEPAKIRSNTRNGVKKEFSLDKMVLVHLLNERDVMLWHQEENHSNERADDDREESVLFQRDKRADVMIREVNYLATRLKPRRSQMEKFEMAKSQVKGIVRDLENKAKTSKWLENAVDRFQELSNPIKLLFQGRGLAELAKLYEDGEEKLAMGAQSLNCIPGSWAYNNLGQMLHSQLWGFTPSTDLRSRINESAQATEGLKRRFPNVEGENWDIIEGTRFYRKVWASLFEMRGRKEKPLNKESALRIAIRGEMKSYLKAFILDNQNISTYATEDLLRSNLKLERGNRVKFCKVKRTKVQWKAESNAPAKPGLERLEREFKRQYGLWPRKLRSNINHVMTLSDSSSYAV